MVRMRSPVRIWLSAPKEKRPLMGALLFSSSWVISNWRPLMRSILQSPGRACGPVRQFESGYLRRRKLHIACDDFFILRIKSHLALVPLLLLSKSKPHGRSGPRRQLRPSAVLSFDFVGGRWREARIALPPPLVFPPEIWYFILVRKTLSIPYRRVEQP